MTATNTATTTNQAWGFWGTMGTLADEAWPLACNAIATAVEERIEDVRDFLESKHGRHFADGVINFLHSGNSLDDAITKTTQQWMTWRIDSRTAKQYDIPRGLPYLTGFVVACSIQA